MHKTHISIMDINELENELRTSINNLEIELENIEVENDMEAVRMKRNQYVRIKRKKQEILISNDEKMILQAASKLMRTYQRKEKILQSLNQDLILLMEDGCRNCKRKNPSESHSGMTPYILSYKRHQVNHLIKRKAFVCLDMDRSSEEKIILCMECTEYFTNSEKEGSSFVNTWPSFLWSILTDGDILDTYGDYAWRFVPLKWRHWWIHVVHEYEKLSDVNIDNPSPIFKDVTEEIQDMKDGLDINSLSEIMRVFNHHLMPTVLCPWGESEYIHKCGKVPFDSILQRFLPKCIIKKSSPSIDYQKVDSSRDDYVRESIDQYDVLLLNPSWRVLPSISFIEGKGPHVMTCREHDEGSKHFYIHPPRIPSHIIPSAKGDQLCHAVIKPRLIKPMKAMQYSNTYQMHEQRGSFQGIDTCDITTFGDFSYCSVLLDESESRTIKHRPDINALLDHLEKDGCLPNITVNGLRKRSIESGPSDEVVATCLFGSTYIDIDDAMQLQYEVGKGKGIKINLAPNNPGMPSEVNTRRSWIPSIVHCQKLDAGGYGARFSDIPQFSYPSTDTRVLWILSGMLVCVKELWISTDKCEIHVSKWHGWLMTYLTRKCFPSVKIVPERFTPIKNKFVTTVDKLIEKTNIGFSTKYKPVNLVAKFEEHENVCVLFKSMVKDITDMFLFADENDEIIIIVYDEWVEGEEIAEYLTLQEEIFELRFISSTENLDNKYKWDGSIFCRHGGEHHKSWWVHKRHNKRFLQTKSGNCDGVYYSNVDVCVYVTMRKLKMESLMHDFMTYIGGQVRIKCLHHKLPLITNNKKDEKCYQRIPDTEGRCGRKVSFKCPDLRCKCLICKNCYQKAIQDGVEFVETPRLPSHQIQYVSDSESMDSSESDQHDTENGSINEELNFEENFGEIIMETEHDDFNDFVVVGADDDIPSDNVTPEFFPTTISGDQAYLVEEDSNKGDYVSGHVIMNQCGSLLNHNDREIIGFSSQKYFLQRIASITDGNSLPLLYPEAMLFPSIFWSMVPNCGSILGAIPSGLFVQSNCHGFANMKSHVRSRLCLPSSSTSTNPSYISFMYDILVNLTLNREDSRIILNRGLMESTNETGLQVRSRNDNLMCDTVDNKQTVRNLCSSQKYHKMDFFLTFTCNQSEHFGLLNIKRWLDGSSWENYFPNFDRCTLVEQT